LSDFYFNIGKNVAFGAREVEAKEAEKLEEQRKAEKLEEQRKAEKLEELRKEVTRVEKKRKSPEKEVSPDSGEFGSSRSKSLEPLEAEQAVSEKEMGSDGTEERKSSIKEAAKEVPKAINDQKRREDAIAAAKERFLARKKAKIEEYVQLG